MRRLRLRWDLGLRDLVQNEWRTIVSRKHLQADVVAGVTVACVAVPLSLAIALASGVTPAAGLVTAIIAGMVCALLGGTRLAVSGPAAAMAVLTASIVESHGTAGLLVVVFLCGALQLLTGMFRLGRLIWFVPVPVIAGFTAGIGAIIFIGQLPRALGLPVPEESHVLDVVAHLGQYVSESSGAAMLLSGTAAAITLALPRYFPRVPAALVGVVVASMLALTLQLDAPTIGAIPRSLPWPELPTFPTGELLPLLMATLVTYALASLETLLSSSAVDKLVAGARHDPDQEMIGQGAGNLVVSLFGGLPVTGVIARTALNVQAGAKTRRASMIHSLALLLTVFALAPVIGRIPLAALAGVLLAIAIRMLHPRELLMLMRVSRVEAAIYLITFVAIVLGGLLVGVRTGLVAAFAIAAFRLSQVKAEVEPAEQPDTIRVTLRGSITFLSSSNVEALRAELEVLAADAVIFDLHKVAALDVSGAEMLARLVLEVDTRGGRVALVGLSSAHASRLVGADATGRVAARMAATETDVRQLLNPGRMTRPMERMVAGARRFQQSSDRSGPLLLERLSAQQNPHTLFISCADSRVVPTLLTATDPGELLQVRNLGNIVPPLGRDDTPAEGAAVEYALTRLHVTEIVICGHSGCGAMTALLARDAALGMPSVTSWLRPAAPLLDRLPSDATPADAARANVLLQLEHLRTYPIVRERLAAGELEIHGWYYDILSGGLSGWDDRAQRFVPFVAPAAHVA